MDQEPLTIPHHSMLGSSRVYLARVEVGKLRNADLRNTWLLARDIL